MGVYGEDTRIHASLLPFIGSLVNSAHVTRFASWYQSPSTKSVHQLTKNSNNQSFPIFCVISSHFLLRDQKSTPTKTKKTYSYREYRVTNKKDSKMVWVQYTHLRGQVSIASCCSGPQQAPSNAHGWSGPVWLFDLGLGAHFMVWKILSRGHVICVLQTHL